MLYTEHPSYSSVDITGGNWAGTAIVSSATANAYGAWTQIHAGLDFTCAWLQVSIGLGYTSAITRNAYFDIGIGPTSTSVEILVPKLCGSHSQAHGASNYYLPLYIPKATKIWVRHQNTVASSSIPVNLVFQGGSSTGGTMSPRVSRYEVIGSAGTGTTTGIACVPGNAYAYGAWTQMAASTTSSYMGFLISGPFIVDTAFANLNSYTFDVGVGPAGQEKILISSGLMAWNTSTEQTSRSSNASFTEVAAGSRLVARGSCSGTADTAVSVLVLGMIA